MITSRQRTAVRIALVLGTIAAFAAGTWVLYSSQAQSKNVSPCAQLANLLKRGDLIVRLDPEADYSPLDDEDDCERLKHDARIFFFRAGVHKHLGLPQFNDMDASALRALPSLESVGLAHSGVSDLALDIISHHAMISDIDLSDTKISDDGLRKLVALPLRIVRLSDTRIGDTGARHLSEIKTVEILNINGTKITDMGIKSLATLPRLRHLNISHTSTTSQSLAELDASHSLEVVTIDPRNNVPLAEGRRYRVDVDLEKGE